MVKRQLLGKRETRKNQTVQEILAKRRKYKEKNKEKRKKENVGRNIYKRAENSYEVEMWLGTKRWRFFRWTTLEMAKKIHDDAIKFYKDGGSLEDYKNMISTYPERKINQMKVRENLHIKKNKLDGRYHVEVFYNYKNHKFGKFNSFEEAKYIRDEAVKVVKNGGDPDAFRRRMGLREQIIYHQGLPNIYPQPNGSFLVQMQINNQLLYLYKWKTEEAAYKIRQQILDIADAGGDVMEFKESLINHIDRYSGESENKMYGLYEMGENVYEIMIKFDDKHWRFFHWNLLEAAQKVRDEAIEVYESGLCLNDFMKRIKNYPNRVSKPEPGILLQRNGSYRVEGCADGKNDTFGFWKTFMEAKEVKMNVDKIIREGGNVWEYKKKLLEGKKNKDSGIFLLSNGTYSVDIKLQLNPRKSFRGLQWKFLESARKVKQEALEIWKKGGDLEEYRKSLLDHPDRYIHHNENKNKNKIEDSYKEYKSRSFQEKRELTGIYKLDNGSYGLYIRFKKYGDYFNAYCWKTLEAAKQIRKQICDIFREGGNLQEYKKSLINHPDRFVFQNEKYKTENEIMHEYNVIFEKDEYNDDYIDINAFEGDNKIDEFLDINKI